MRYLDVKGRLSSHDSIHDSLDHASDHHACRGIGCRVRDLFSRSCTPHSPETMKNFPAFIPWACSTKTGPVVLGLPHHLLSGASYSAGLPLNHCVAERPAAFGPMGTRKNQQSAILSESTIGRRFADIPLRSRLPSWIRKLVAKMVPAASAAIVAVSIKDGRCTKGAAAGAATAGGAGTPAPK